MQKENGVRGDDEEEGECVDHARILRMTQYVWLMKFLFGCIMHLTDSKNEALTLDHEITVVQIGPNHDNVDTLQDDNCGAWAVVRGQKEIQVFDLDDTGHCATWSVLVCTLWSV